MIKLNSWFKKCAVVASLVWLSACGNSEPPKKELLVIDWHKPGQWVVVNYWATWCSYCRQEVPELNKLAEEGVQVVGISAVPIGPSDLELWRTETQATYPLMSKSPADLAAQVGRVERLPTTFLVGPEGKLIGPFIGSVTKEELQRYMKGEAK